MTGEPDRILLVEDNPGDVNLLRKALDETGLTCELTVANRVREAVDLLTGREGERVPDLVFLDINIPGRGGVELLEEAELEGVEAPTVVLTSSSREKDMERCGRSGASAYVVKPDTYGELLGKVEKISKFYLETGD